MVAVARLALLLLGCVGLLQPAGECYNSGGNCCPSGAGREPCSSPDGDAGCPHPFPWLLPHPFPHLFLCRCQVHRLLPQGLVLPQAQLFQVLPSASELGRGRGKPARVRTWLGTPHLPEVPWHCGLSLQRQCQASHAGAHLAWVEGPWEAATLKKVISYYQRAQSVWLGLHYKQEVRT